MPTVSTFIYCEKAEPDQNGKLTVVQPLLSLIPAFIPGMFSFSIAAGLKGLKEGMELRVLFKTPNSQDAPLVDTKTIKITKDFLGGNPLNLPDSEQGVVFNMDLRNIVLKDEGYYKTEIIADGTSLGEFPIYVKGKETL
ncbi:MULTISPECIES: DUF6941 family protein [Bacillus]|uniref:DUF6941 family protein n=1 Tax=Bacillus TaxID=1386 RepID=UPI00103F5CC4|nr:hypothetical protein [Bacillus subtilis]QBJ83503.1 hypothetical protein DL538_16330 [Bacillus subtilis subsp. subtilis]